MVISQFKQIKEEFEHLPITDSLWSLDDITKLSTPLVMSVFSNCFSHESLIFSTGDDWFIFPGAMTEDAPVLNAFDSF